MQQHQSAYPNLKVDFNILGQFYLNVLISNSMVEIRDIQQKPWIWMFQSNLVF